MLRNGRCTEILYEKSSKESCCANNRIHTAWSPEDFEPSTFFFWRVLGDGIRCTPCKGTNTKRNSHIRSNRLVSPVSCKDVECEPDKTCVIKKGRPKCVCSSKCKELKTRSKRGPICGTDGRSYRNICRLKKRACRKKTHTLSIAYTGTCQSE